MQPGPLRPPGFERGTNLPASAGGERVAAGGTNHAMRYALLLFMAFTLGLRAADLTPAFEAANKLYEEGKYPDAIAAYDKLLETGNASAALYFNRGNAFLKLGQLGRA